MLTVLPSAARSLKRLLQRRLRSVSHAHVDIWTPEVLRSAWSRSTSAPNLSRPDICLFLTEKPSLGGARSPRAHYAPHVPYPVAKRCDPPNPATSGGTGILRANTVVVHLFLQIFFFFLSRAFRFHLILQAPEWTEKRLLLSHRCAKPNRRETAATRERRGGFEFTTLISQEETVLLLPCCVLKVEMPGGHLFPLSCFPFSLPAPFSERGRDGHEKAKRGKATAEISTSYISHLDGKYCASEQNLVKTILQVNPARFNFTAATMYRGTDAPG